MLLLRGATCAPCLYFSAAVLFQYMLLLRGATPALRKAYAAKMFQYMLLLRGATDPDKINNKTDEVSIHAPLARSNKSGFGRVLETCSFNTCSSCEEQLGASCFCSLLRRFQYMLLLRGATEFDGAERGHRSFNTCSSCEEQQFGQLNYNNAMQFQYMLLLRGATS